MTDYLRQRVLLLRHRKTQPVHVPEKPAAAAIASMQPIIPQTGPRLLEDEVASLAFPATDCRCPRLSRLCRVGCTNPLNAPRDRQASRNHLPRDRRRNRQADRPRHVRSMVSAPVSLGRQRKESGRRIPACASDQIIADQGPAGLYTSTLFDFKPELCASHPRWNWAGLSTTGISEELFTAADALERHRPVRLPQSAVQDSVWAGEHQQRLPVDVAAVDGAIPPVAPELTALARAEKPISASCQGDIATISMRAARH